MENLSYKGYQIEIFYEDNPENPLTWGSEVKFCLFHNSYTLQNDTDLKSGDFNNWQDVKAAIKEAYNVIAILPVYMYDHGGIAINTTGYFCPWDSGQIGYAFIDKDLAKEIGWEGRDKKTLKGYIKSSVELYSNYLGGFVYGYSITAPDGENIETCGGFYGSDHEKSGLIDEAQACIDAEIRWKLKNRIAKLKELIRYKVPINTRIFLLNNQKYAL